MVAITLDRSEAASLHAAASTLRWLLAKTERGWSHPALDPDACAESLARLEVIYNEARGQLKTARAAVVRVNEGDAILLREFTVLVKQVDRGGFEDLVHQLSQIALAIDPPRPWPLQRGRPSGLAEP